MRVHPIVGFAVLAVLVFLPIPAFPVQVHYKENESYSRPATFQVLSVGWKDVLVESAALEPVIQNTGSVDAVFVTVAELYDKEGSRIAQFAPIGREIRAGEKSEYWLSGLLFEFVKNLPAPNAMVLEFFVESVDPPDATFELLLADREGSRRIIAFEAVIRNTDRFDATFALGFELCDDKGLPVTEPIVREIFVGASEERSFTYALFVPKDAGTRKEYSVDPPTITDVRTVTNYRTTQKSVIAMLPPSFYAISLAGIPVLIALTVAWLPLSQKIVVRLGVVRFLRMTSIAGMILLLISAPLPWIEMFLGARLQNSWSLLTYLLNLPRTVQGLGTILAQGFPTVALSLAVALGTYLSAVLAGITSQLFRRRKLLLLSLLLSGVLCIASVSSWTYAVEVAKAEPIWSPYTVEAGVGPLLGIVAGALLLVSYRLSTRLGCLKDEGGRYAKRGKRFEKTMTLRNGILHFVSISSCVHRIRARR